MSLRFGNVAGTALKAMEDQGLTHHPKPQFEIPRLPFDLTELDDEGLMLLYSSLTAYADFVSVQVSCAQIDERALEKELSMTESKKMLSSEGKSENRVTFARAQVAIDPVIVDLKGRLEATHAYRKLIESFASNIERDSNLVSRELTRRTATVARRSNRWSA